MKVTCRLEKYIVVIYEEPIQAQLKINNEKHSREVGCIELYILQSRVDFKARN